jgi:hypothetical protein
MHTVVSMGRVVRQADVGGRLRLVVLDTLGREFALYFETSEELLDITLVRLPEGVEWRVDTFQEMVGVRDEAYEYLQNDGHSLSDFCLNLEDVVLYEDDPYAEQ